MADQAETPASDLAWLDALEQRVHDTTARLRELGEENARLSARVGELEAELESATPESAEDASAAWKQERKDIRKRVEALTRNLEDLLDGE